MAQILIQQGVRRGCVLFPLLLNIYFGYRFNKTLQVKNNDINQRYADDTAFITNNPKAIQQLLNEGIQQGDH